MISPFSRYTPGSMPITPREDLVESLVSHRVLIVDDEPTIRVVLQRFLERQGYQTIAASGRNEAEALFLESHFDAVVLDYQLGDGNALGLMAWLKKSEIEIPVIVLTGNGSIDVAVQAILNGAEHFLTKPVDLPAFGVILTRVLENRRNRRRDRLRPRKTGVDPFLGTSRAICDLAEVATKLAAADSPILIHGETGTGKGVLARWLHEQGPRADQAFVDVNCASLSPEFLDSELFGHQRGAFTGAIANKAGLLEVGHRGTVFLDEIGDIDLRVQPKLLKVLEEKRFRRMGEVNEREVNVRLIAASHQDLRQCAKEKLFREDLYFRISTLPLEIAPLRERREDILPLAESMMTQLGKEMGRGTLTFSDAAVAAMDRYPWPGNIRELRNVLERAVLLSGSDQIEENDLHFETPMAAKAQDLSLKSMERRHVERVLTHVEGGVSAAARILGVSRSTLYQKIKTHGIELSKS
jgi:DNA-binding NtrC family response regulator